MAVNEAKGPLDRIPVLELGNYIVAATAGRLLADFGAEVIKIERPEGLGVANSIAAIQVGAGMVDGALGGLGGCPFAPGASGNTSTEDLLFALQPKWLTPAIFSGVVTAGVQLLDQLDEPNRSRAAQGARSKADAFPWVR